jgi:hypothetical protein
MDVQTSRLGPRFCRITLRPQRDEITTCNPLEQRGLPPTLKGRSDWLCRNPLQKYRGGFGSRGLAPVDANPPHLP